MALKTIFALALLVVCAASAPLKQQAPAIPRKALAGPPEEFASHSLPDPSVGALDSQSAAYFIVFEADASGVPTWTRVISVDSTVGYSLNVFSPVQGIKVSLIDPNGAAVDLDKYATEVFWPYWDSAEENIKGTSYNVDNPIDGNYKLTITAPTMTVSEISQFFARTTKQHADVKHGYVVLYNAEGDLIFSHLMAYTQLQGDQVGLLARMYNHGTQLARGQVPDALPDIVQDAELEAVFPDGHRLKKPMHDDGLHNDGAANDGVYGASFGADEIGMYTVQATLQGTGATGPFIRTTQHLVEIIPRMLQLTSHAFGRMSDNLLNVYLEVTDKTIATATYRPYFQLWGKSASGADIPVAWISSIEDVETIEGRSVLALQVDTHWIARAQASSPFTLRDVYVQDVQSWIPLSQVASIPLVLDAPTIAALSANIRALTAMNYDGSITKEMMEGVPPARTNGTNGGKLILMHGYCADKNPFQVYPEDWTDALFFLRTKAALSHDEYAQLIVQFAADNGLSSYGLVGHSQGGIVTLHTLNYYFTGLDSAVGARKIQSLASPYNGNTAAGSLADLGKVFGMGCGAVNDMSVDGAALWMAGVTANAISQANYYTTVYDKGGLFGGGWCNMLTNALLNKPNDGTTEMKYATLNGGNHRSHVIGQCHIDGMNWPASYWDHTRNAEMNAEAAR